MTQLTSGQVARIQARKQSWGGHTWSGLAEVYRAYRDEGHHTDREAARAVDQELAHRIAWLRLARQTPETEDVGVLQVEVDAIYREMAK